jgi:FMN phosphatase YigB (HAD superfamily)
MKLSLLLDLDDTLLGNDINSFLPVYLTQLGRNFSKVSTDDFVKKLMAATQTMVNKDDPRQTLEQAFDQVFYPSLQVEKKDVIATLERFYDQEFGRLSYLTQRRPDAIRLVQQAFASGIDVVIATNPIFPRSAIQHRLNWAGVGDLPFSLVTSLENFHFAKPNPAYFAEILSQLGCQDQPAVMVGNSLEDDLLPAAVLGIPGYLVTSKPVLLPTNLAAPIQQGPIKAVWPWIQQMAAQSNTAPTSMESQAILAALKAAPAALESLCRQLTPAQWVHQPVSQEWSVTEILCHMRDVDREVNFPRLQALQTEEAPFLPGVVTDPWAIERSYLSQSGQAAMEAFMSIRAELTGFLNQMNIANWQRPARHAIFGPTTVLELLGFVVTHDIVHIRQAFHTIASSKKEILV